MVQEFRGPVAESEDGSGTGGALFTSGNEYDGAFYQNKLHGKGTYKWQDGTTYEGEFGNNKMTGYGKYTWIQGSIYTGEFKDGKKHGQGTFVLQMDSEGNRYEGGWKEGKPCGHGHLIYQNGASYTGEFENGLRHGKGRLVYASGNVYDGEWKDNVKHGHGKMTWTTKGEEYDGNWFEGKPDGMGTYIWRLNAIRDHQYPLLNIYRGTFVEGMRHGFGVFQYANGARYEGEWFQNLKHGKAKFSTDNGRQYIGTFDNDRPTIPFSRFENSVPYVFRVPQEQGHTVEGVLSDLNNIIFRHVIELRKIYHYYCHLAQRHSDEPRNVITRDIVWKLFKEIGITKQVTLVDVDRACAILYKGDLIAEHRYHEPHVPSTEFILHDFIEILVLTSHHLYKNCKERSIHQVGIAASFAYMIKTDLLPHSHGLHQEDETLTEDEKVVKSLYNDFYLLYGEKMSNLYHDLAKKQPHALSQSRKDFTMTVRQVLLTLKEYKILDQYKTLSISRVIESFAKIYPFIHDGDSYNLEFELVSMDVFEGIFHACYGSVLELVTKPIRNKTPEEQEPQVLPSTPQQPTIVVEEEKKEVEKPEKPTKKSDGKKLGGRERKETRATNKKGQITPVQRPPSAKKEENKEQLVEEQAQEEKSEAPAHAGSIQQLHEQVEEPVDLVPLPERLRLGMTEFFQKLFDAHTESMHDKSLVEAYTLREHYQKSIVSVLKKTTVQSESMSQLTTTQLPVTLESEETPNLE